MKGGKFSSMIGDNKPTFYEVKSIRGGAIPKEVTDNQIIDAKANVADAQNELSTLMTESDSYNKYNYQEEEKQCNDSKKIAKEKMREHQEAEDKHVSKKCDSYNKLKPKNVSEETKETEEIEETEPTKTVEKPKTLSEESETLISSDTKKALSKLAVQYKNSNGKSPNVLYIDQRLQQAIDKANSGVSVFSGGGDLYFMDNKSKKTYKQNTRSTKGKNMITSFLNNGQKGGNLLTPDGKIFLTKNKSNKTYIGGDKSFETSNLGHVYQTQGGASKQKKSTKSKKVTKPKK